MKKRKLTGLLLLGTVMLSLSACGSSQAETTSKEAVESSEEPVAETVEVEESDNSRQIYEAVLSEEHIDVDIAYEQLSGLDLSGEEEKAFVQKLSELVKCEGRFVHEYEDTGNRYTADVAFYLERGETYCTVVYKGYMGTIGDGLVIESTDSNYLFESAPKGDLFGHEQDFSIHFSESQLHIEWADSCDALLDRGDGSAEYAQDYKTPFDQTEAYDSLVSLVDNVYQTAGHSINYDAKEKDINIYIEAPESTRANLIAGKDNSELQEAWQRIIDSTTEFDDKLLSAVKVSGSVDTVNIYWVDELHDDQGYTTRDYILWVSNGKVKLNVAGGNTAPESSYSTPKPTPSESTNSYDSSYDSSHKISAGEWNALQTALDYLEVMAFSYSGLVEQLEYEGYTRAEAEYAADNCGADWNEQAAKKAEEYLDVMSFSRDGLIEQLEYEGFTHSQAEYGVNRVY